MNSRDKLGKDGEESMWRNSSRFAHKTNQTISTMLNNKHNNLKKAKTQGFILRFDHTTKVSYSLLRSLQRVVSFPTLILHKLTTKVKANFFLNLAQQAGDKNFLGSSRNLETPKQPQPVKE
jgi:hypothetical protein